VNDQKLTLYLLVGAETFHSTSQFMPDLGDVHDQPYETHVDDVRRGEVYSGAWSFVIALIIAHATNSAVPFAIWLAVTAASCGVYEYHLRQNA
jgi:hypothetical protein